MVVGNSYKIRVKCISKVRDKSGVIRAYNLKDDRGREYRVSARKLKEEMITSKDYEFINLKMDKAGRIIDKKITNNNNKNKNKKSVKSGNITVNMLNEAKRAFDNEIYYAGGTGAFQFTVRKFEKYCKEYNKTLDDLIAVIPEEFQKGLHTALIYYIYENDDSAGDCKKAVESISKYEGEIIGKLAVHLLKKYGNHLGEYECSSITRIDKDLGYQYTAYGIYKRKHKGKDVKKINWENILGGLRESSHIYGNIDMYYGDTDKTKDIQLEKDIIEAQGKKLWDKYVVVEQTLFRYKNYHQAEGEENINVFVTCCGTCHNSCKENMFRLIKDYEKIFDYYGITAELYCNLDKGFLKLYCE